MYTKYHGCGNDFIITEYKEGLDYKDISKRICNRYTGIGADTFITIKNKELIEIDFYNADGSYAPMCGNGIRCAAAYIKNKGWKSDTSYQVKTSSGIRTIYLVGNEYKINMGKPDYSKHTLSIDTSSIGDDKEELFDYNYEYKGDIYNLNAVFMTTHHLVIVRDDLNISDEIGEFFCKNEIFKKMINVNFVQIIDEENIRIKTYERGIGWTKACGSGSTSAFAVLRRKGILKDFVNIHNEYGDIKITIEENDLYMQGPAVMISDRIDYK